MKIFQHTAKSPLKICFSVCRNMVLFLLFIVPVIFSQDTNYTWQRVNSRAAFLERDGAGIIAFNSKLWLLGGWNPFEFKPNEVTNEIWSSADGFSWIFEGNAQWSARHLHGTIVFQNKLCVLCGDERDGTYKKDVWNTSDGINWVKILDNAPWGNRASPYITVFNDKIWLMGGQEFQPLGDSVYNDIWNSDDGVNWQKVVETAPWKPRSMIHGSAILDNKMWIFGGGNYNNPREYYHDVWSSSDGITWDSVNASPPWHPRAFVNIASFDNKLWVLDGYSELGDHNDVWFSSDGVSWQQLTGTPWPARHAGSVAVFDSSLWITAGRIWNDVWKLKTNTLIITSPEGGSAKADTIIPIKWKTALSTTVSLDYSVDNGNTWTNIVSGIPASQENYSWHRSLSDPKLVRLRIRNEADPSIIDMITYEFEEVKLKEGLSAFYPLNSEVTDTGPNGLDGVAVDILPNTDRFGNESGAAAFNGVSSLAVLSTQGYLPFTGDFSISFWEKANYTNQTVPLSIGFDPSNFDVYFNSGGMGLWPVWNGGGANGIRTLTIPGQYTNDRWHHIIVTRNGDRVLLFVDGKYKFQTRYVNSIGTGNLILGQSSSSTNKWIGSLDELRIYNRSFNDIEVSTLYGFANHEPQLLSIPDTLLTVNDHFFYSLEITDQDTAVYGDSNSVKYLFGPSWITFDSLNHTFSGVPKIHNTGDTSFSFKIRDLYGSDILKSFDLHISYPNTSPYFLNAPDTVAYEDSLYKWEILAGDSEITSYGDQIKFTLQSGPSWISIDSITGILQGIPSDVHVGDTSIEVRIYDWMQTYKGKLFSISVKHVNHTPIIHTTSLPEAEEDSLYSYTVYATDRDSLLFGDILRYTLAVSPVWLSIDSVTGVLTGVPMAWDVGDTIVTVKITDGKGGETIQTYPLQVNHINHVPYWVADPDTLAKEDAAYMSRVFAKDQDSLLFGDYLRYRIMHGPHWLTLDSIGGELSGTPPNNTEGDTVVAVSVSDHSGWMQPRQWTINILPTNYPPGNTIALSPAHQDTMTLFKTPVNKIFIWTSVADPDRYDTVRYRFELKGPGVDTMITGITDTVVVLNESFLAEYTTYSWRVIAFDGEFEVTAPDSFIFETTQRLANSSYTKTPVRFFLYQNYPNPFNPNTLVRFQVPERSKVRIEVYNILGQRIQKIIDGTLDARYYEIEWTPRSIASGVYFMRMSAEGLDSRTRFRSVKKVIYLK